MSTNDTAAGSASSSSPTSRPTRARSPPASPAYSRATAESYDHQHQHQHQHHHHHHHEDPQLAQDIDAARQMSRARAGSVHGAQLSPTSPRAIPAMAGRRPSMRSTDDPTIPASPPAACHHHPSSSYVSRSPHAPRPSHAAHPAHPSVSVASRFYAQPTRQGSNASLDSASHFIDHRSQPHFSGSNSNVAASIDHRSQPHFSGSNSNAAATISSSLRHASRLGQQYHLDESAVSDEPMSADIDDFARSSDSRRHPSRGSRHSFRQSIDRQRSHRGPSPHGGDETRRPSAAQDDVCFPFEVRTSPGQQQQQAHLHGELGDGVYPDDQRVYEQMQEEIDANRNAAGTLPPGFPYTFDLQALEDYAVEERSKIVSSANVGASSLGAASGLRNRHRGLEAEADNKGSADGTYAISPDSDDATFYSRRPRRHASGNQNGGTYGTPGSNQNQGRYQRKLALFESGGTAPPPHDILGTRSADANTPLLAGADAKAGSAGPSFQPHQSDFAFGSLVRDDHVENKGGRMGSSQSTPGPNFPGRRARKAGTSAFSLGAGGLGAPTTADKPYRFTFYSNALPSTIHARHLAELPAKGQSFEELFSGLDAGSLGGNGEEGEQQKSGESTAAATMTEETAAAHGNGNGGRTTNNGGNSASGAKPDPAAAGGNPQASALAAQLAVRSGGVLGRKEGTTAPPTRTGTPVPGGSGRNSLSAMRGANTAGAGNGGGGGGGGGGAAGGGGMARTVPGGGIRMDQDPEANTWWLDVLSPTDQEMKLLSRVFGIHPLTTEDILMEETREKIELFRNYYLVCFRSFDQDPYSPTYLEPLNMYIIVFREGTLSFHFRATPHPQNVRRRIKQLKDYINVTSDWISYALIDDITDAFGPLIQSIEYEVDSIDELVLILKEVEQSDMLRRIGACRKKVMGLLRLMGNKADVVKGLAKRCNENWSVAPKSDIGLYLSDIQDHLITMTQNLSHFEKILSRSHSNYLAQISIEMTEANNRANDVLSKLTALGTVIVPLNVITGLWGMNVNVPGQDVPNLNWFGGLVAFMIAIACGGYWVAIRYLQR